MKKIFIPIVVALLLIISLPQTTDAATGEYTITFYCSACNSPKHSTEVALQGSSAYVGTCASNSFPLGSTIYVEGYGELLVNDRMKHKGMIDIYRGDFDTCTCEGKEKGVTAYRVDK